MSVNVVIELTADTLEGIGAAAMEAQSYLKCDIAFHDKKMGSYGAKLIANGVDVQDEQKLFDIILETTGIPEKHFRDGAYWNAAQARHLFGFYARKYLEWSWSQIADVIARDRTTAIQGVQGIIKLAAGHPGAFKKADTKVRQERMLKLREDMERIQRKWSEIKR